MDVSAQQLAGLSPTHRRLVALLLRRGQVGGQAELSGDVVSDEVRFAPLSFGQQRLWVLQQLAPGSTTYTMRTAVRVVGRLDVGVVWRSIQAIVARHAVLRTTFRVVGDQPQQVIAPRLLVALRVIDLGGMPPGVHDSLVQEISLREIAEPFDLVCGPLVRAWLVRLGADAHVLLLPIHHIVSDGWSQGIQLAELAALYEAFCTGSVPVLPELPMQYADYARWQEMWLRDGLGDSQLEYWRRQLDGVPTLVLPVDRERSALSRSRAGEVLMQVSPEVTVAVRELARAEGATLFMVLLAVFFVVLARYSGQDDVAVGSPISGRRRAEVEGLIGFFVNTLVLRGDLAGNPPFRVLVGRVRAMCMAAYENQDVPFEYVVKAVQPWRDLSRSPLFQVFFALQNYQVGTLQAADVTLIPLAVRLDEVKFDLSLVVSEVGGGIRGVWEYNAALFDVETVVRLQVHFQQVLLGCVTDPDCCVALVPLLTDGERRQLVCDWNATQRDFPQGQTLYELFSVQAGCCGDVVAVVYEDVFVTYGVLRVRANQVGQFLCGLGVGPEVCVGVCLERSVSLVVAVMGVWAAGGAYVPLDPAYPAERLAFMLADSGARVVLTQADVFARARFPAMVRAVCLDGDWGVIARMPTVTPVVMRDAEQLAYVMYTSGSTGVPKGVLIAQCSVVNLVGGLAELVYVEAGGGPLRVGVNGPLVFDTSVKQVVQVLCGHTLYVVPGAVRFDGWALRAFLERVRLDVLDCTPAQLRVLVEAGVLEGAFGLPAVVLVGGEAIDAGLWARLGAVRGFVNVYGPTECTVDTTLAWVTPMRGRPSIGRPIANVQVYVVDRWFQPVPVGVVGELCIGGAGVGRGYLGYPERTAECFVPNPFGVGGEKHGVGAFAHGVDVAEDRNLVSSSRLYKTGDLVRWCADGMLEFLGRGDHQVKVRGFRVELGEIEVALRRHAAVRDAVVVVREDRVGDGVVVAYVVFERSGGVTPTVVQLRAFLGVGLPAYMVPSRFVVLDRLPLSAHGKVDRAALPVPQDEEGVLLLTADVPQTPTEELLAGIWAEVLGVRRVGRGDDFFALGGHSLRATQVVARVREAFGCDVPLRLLFEVPVLAEFAVEVERVYGAALGVSVPVLVPTERVGVVPLSFAQQRLWFLEQVTPGLATYVIARALRLRGALDVGALRAGFAAVLGRHEVLRTTFAVVDGQPCQQVADVLSFRFPVVDVSGLAGDVRDACVMRLAAAEAVCPFDLGRGPLVRVTLVRVAGDVHVLLLTLHHCIADGWSMGVLVRDLLGAYALGCAGGEVVLAVLPIQYADYAIWQRGWFQGALRDVQVGFWRRQLAGVVPLDLPLDYVRPGVASGRGARLPFVLPGSLCDGLVALSRAQGVTLFMTLLAAFQVFLMRISGQDDVAVGTPIAHRTQQVTEGLIGFFVNTLVLRGDLSGGPSFRALVQRLRGVCLDAYAHQDAPFEAVVEVLQPMRDLSRNPLFQVLFVLQNVPTEELVVPGLEVKSLPIGATTTKFDLTLTVTEGVQGFQGAWEYATDLFAARTIARFHEQFLVLLMGCVADPGCRVDRLPLLTDGERRQVVCDWNATWGEFPDSVDVPGLFALQVASRPDAVVLRWGDEQVSYAGLDGYARRIAFVLRGFGVRAEVCVGVCLERSPMQVAALLAVLVAGGCYLSLDPGYPPERLAFLVGDSGASVVLTRRAVQGCLSADVVRGGCQVVCLDDVAFSQGAMLAGGEGDPARLMYVVYTSGSTGVPKGVLGCHRALVNRCVWMWREYPFGVDEVGCYRAPVSFVDAVWEVFGVLLRGVPLVVVPDVVVHDVHAFVGLLARERVTRLVLVPSLLQVLLDAVSDLAMRVPQVWLWTSSGEALSVGLARRFAVRLPQARLLNLYGASEVAADATVAEVVVEPDQVQVSIGRPIANMQVYVLDRAMEVVPVGVWGELYVGGVGLARGYHGRFDLTAERFVPNPFGVGGEDGALRLYRTGDVVRWGEDGCLEFLGRVDQQVKVHGVRIELGEVEAALVRVPAVREAVVLVREDEPGVRRLVGYVVFQAGVSEVPSSAQVRAFLRGLLPASMVPSVVVVLSGLPLTPHGKVDRGALPAPVYAVSEDAGVFVAPRTQVEVRLAAIWSAVLGVARVGVYDNFFAIGGDSIRSLLVIARAREVGLRFTPDQIFRCQTIAELALVEGVGVQVEQGVVSGRVPLLPVQHWFFERDLPPPYHWFLSSLLLIEQPLVFGLLREALAWVFRHHDGLRAQVARVGEGWEVVLAPSMRRVPLTCFDLSGVPVFEQAGAIVAVARQVQMAMPLVGGPSLRVAWMRLGAGQPTRLLVMLHHFFGDAVSWRIVLEDFQTVYAQLSRGLAVRLPPKTSSVQEFGERLVAFAASAEARRSFEEYWVTRPWHRVVPLPVDYVGGSGANTVESTRGVAMTLGADETEVLLHHVLRVHGVQVMEVLLTALGLALAPWVGSSVFLVDVVGHGRDTLFEGIDVSRTVGWLTIALPLVLDVGEVRDPVAALQAVKQQMPQRSTSGIEFQALRYLSPDAAVRECLRAFPPYQIVFNYLGQIGQPTADGLTVGPAPEAAQVAALELPPGFLRQSLLHCSGSVQAGRLALVLRYSESVHRRETIEALAQRFVAVLRGLIADVGEGEVGVVVCR